MSSTAVSVARGALTRLKSHIAGSWFAPADPRALAICRVLVFYLPWPGFKTADVTPYATYAGSTFRAFGLPAWLHVPLLPIPALELVGLLKAVSTGLALVGLAYRFTAPLAALTTLYLTWIIQSSGKLNHGGLLLQSVLLMLAFSRAADAWSLDAWIRKLRGRPPPEPSAEYRWPRRFIALMVVSMYGAAGISKLKASGLEWALSDNFRLLLLSHHFTHQPLLRVGVWLADSSAWCQVLASLALLLELCAPLALLHRVAYALVVPSLALLQLCIWLLMGVRFIEMLPIFACLLPWDAILARGDRFGRALRGRLRARERASY